MSEPLQWKQTDPMKNLTKGLLEPLEALQQQLIVKKQELLEQMRKAQEQENKQ
jgi:hypothetical protein